ncbi:hypothetical protein [Thermohalobacter berrensis]|uniref:hypothetical protein n=1 Tax=Thermohalobacter berrensis TaxID=99594 RepID=UPI0015FED7C5|nr:hypothetical protein [Thermohalobacter berrensis]
MYTIKKSSEKISEIIDRLCNILSNNEGNLSTEEVVLANRLLDTVISEYSN